MDIRLKGITKKIKKDINRPARLKKFQLKKGKNAKVLKLVEKTKYIIDSKGEKRELKRLKKIKKSSKKPSKKITNKKRKKKASKGKLKKKKK